MRILMFVFALVCVSGCASNPPVVSIGPDTYLISRQGSGFWVMPSKLKVEAIEEARMFCSQHRRSFRILNTREIPSAPGRFPEAEVQFMCLEEGDPELTRPKLQQEADVVVENRASNPATPQGHEDDGTRVPVAIHSEPAGADVYLDGTFVGNTPLPDFELTPGDHVLRVEMAGYSPWERSIRVVEGSPTQVRATLKRAPDGNRGS